MELAIHESSKAFPLARPPELAPSTIVNNPSVITAAERGVLDEEVIHALSSDGTNLVERLQCGDIRLVNTAWLVLQPASYRIQRRQELEALEASGASPSPLLSTEAAVRYLNTGDRSVAALSCMLHRLEPLPRCSAAPSPSCRLPPLLSRRPTRLRATVRWLAHGRQPRSDWRTIAHPADRAQAYEPATHPRPLLGRARRGWTDQTLDPS